VTKTHFVSPHRPDTPACRLSKGRTTDNPFQVTCSLCKGTTRWFEALANAQAAKKAAFEAQVPTQHSDFMGRPIMCSCGNDTFRYQGRSCMGHYEDYVCSNCGAINSRLTETGMSF
jgi:hypothetical protein